MRIIGKFWAHAAACAALIVSVVGSAEAAGWTGTYLGVHGGYGWGNSTLALNTTDLQAPGANFNLATVVPSINSNWKGGLGGAQFGHNWLVASNFVAGLQIDGSFAGIGGRKTVITNVPGFVQFTDSVTNKIKFLSSLRARGGFLVCPEALVYVSGGAALGLVRHTRNTVFAGTTGPIGSNSDTRFGWTIGGGAEYRLASDLSVFAEYRYADLGDTKFNTIYPVTGARIRATASNKVNVVAAGFNVSF